MRGWIGVDLDGTLAKYDGWRGVYRIGEPVPLMLNRVKDWLADGIEVKLFTARVAAPDEERKLFLKAWRDWCSEHGLPELEVTNVKDFGMMQLWDDRAVHVVPNTGIGRHS